MAAAKKNVRKACSDDANTPMMDEDKKKSLRRSQDDDAPSDDDMEKADDDDKDDEDKSSDLVDIDTNGNGGAPVETVDDGDVGDFNGAADDDDDSDDEDDDDDDEDDDDDLDKSDEDDDDDDDESIDMTQPASKSTSSKSAKAAVTAETLSKALQAMQSYVRANDVGSRRTALLQKAQRSTLATKERDELFALLAGQDVKKSTLAGQVRRNFRKDETMAKSVQSAAEQQDVSDYLDSLSDNISRSLGTLAKATEASSQRQHSVNLIMCKALAQVGGAVRAIGERMQVLEQQPAREPKSLSANPVQKSFAGNPASANEMSADDILASLTAMNEQSYKEGRRGLSKGGHSITDGVSAMCSSGAIDRGLLSEVQAFAKSQRASH